MTLNTKPFWETNLNPITMYSVSSILRKSNVGKKPNEKQDSNKQDLIGFVTANSLIKELGVGAKRLKYLCKQLGEDPKFNNKKTYYDENIQDKLIELMSKLDVTPEKFNSDLYITNQELIKMFDISQYKSWEIFKNSKLVKRKMPKNQIYYNREKAIAFFSKYLKR